MPSHTKNNFLKTALRDRRVAAFAPSSRYLVRAVLEKLPEPPLDLIVEYGPGDGIMTRELLKILSPSGRLVVVESNEDFVAVLKKISDSDPRLQVMSGKVEEAADRLAEKYTGEADLVISSVPFSWLTKADRVKVLASSFRLLRAGGMFVAFHQYLPAVAGSLKHFSQKVEMFFVPRNIFPCFVIVAEKE